VKREEKIAKEAYHLWESDGKPEGKADYYWHKASLKHPPNIFLKPFYETEIVLEGIVDWLQRLAIIEILGLLGNLTLLVGLSLYFVEMPERRNLDVYQAWKVVAGAYGQNGSGGRIEALEFLNSSPDAPGRRKIPWFWLCWEPESLAKLEAPGAYLRKVNLPDADLRFANLKRTNLFGANFQGADLRYAQFKRANIDNADFRGAKLRHANFQGADFFEQAKFQNADLSSADLEDSELNLSESNLEGAKYTEEDTSKEICNSMMKEPPCPTRFPEGFNPQEAGMVLRTSEAKLETHKRKKRFLNLGTYCIK
jgi:hypothetical protein